MKRFAVVLSRGRYGSGEYVQASAVFGNHQKALQLAKRYTIEYRTSMKPYGGSSGGYRVVPTSAWDRRSARWLGHDLDRTPDAKG